ncbi:PX domain-containing protein [Aphelenchoides bicaudatus]|nr:PX domain-containing protein [Aphelenchoides bicaudatus]
MLKEDPANLLRATIVSTEINEDHVDYTIECCYHLRGPDTWTVKRRFNDFYRLNKNLEPFGFKLGMPSKKFFGNLQPSFIEKRKNELQEFLNNITLHPLIFCSPVVAQFLELADEPLKEYENYVLVAARNREAFRLTSILHGCSWRFYKLFALLNDVGRDEQQDFFVLSWMPFGPDSCIDGSRRSLAILNDCLKFLKGFRSLYFSKSVDSFADHGIGVITNHVRQGTLRDRLYQSKPEDTFIRKYSMNRDCYVIGKMDAIFVARQLLEVIKVLNNINYPFYNFHCGNLLITEESVEVIDIEFALAGHSTFNRHSLIRSKVQTVAEMRLFNFAHCIYEMLTGTLAFPDHDITSALDSVPVEIFELIVSIVRPKEKMPTVDELIGLPIFEGFKVKTPDTQKILIAKHVQDHFSQVCTKIEERLKADRANYFMNVQREYVNRYLSSAEEKSRRRTIIQEHIRNNMQTQKQEETQNSSSNNAIST